jgi:tRNA pseudouridine55 synthase
LSIDGILNIIKPAGMSSFAVVSMVRALSGERRVGHAGTLDRSASGVLPVCLGKATRVIEFMSDVHKTYRAKIRLGVITDSYDADGNVIEESDCSSVTREQLECLIPSFVGTIEQVPPMYSALKLGGMRLHKLARAGVEVELKSRQINIYRIELLNWEPPHFSIDVECGKGTYIRSLAHDIGRALGCGAHLAGLVRSKNGVFDVAEGFTVKQIRDAFTEGRWRDVLQPIDSVLQHMPSVVVDKSAGKNISNGVSTDLNVDGGRDTGWCRAYSAEGGLIALLKYDVEWGNWHPKKVFI